MSGWSDYLRRALGWLAVSVESTPASRIYVVPAETRTYTVEAETRTYIVEA